MSDLAAPAAVPLASGPDLIRRPRGLASPATMVGRCLRLSRRNVDALMTSLTLPIVLMLLFVYLFGGAIHTGGRYVTYVVPGVMLLCAAFGSSLTAVSVCQDMTGGIVDRFRSLNVGGGSVVAGHVAASAIRNAISSLLVFGVAFAIGFRPHAGVGMLAAAGVLLAFIVAISWFSAAIGLLAKTPEAASGFTFTLMFLPYPSSAFVPIDTMPSWLRGFAQHQPATPVIESLRGLLLGQPVGDRPWLALAWCGGILLVAIILSRVLFRRRTA